MLEDTNSLDAPHLIHEMVKNWAYEEWAYSNDSSQTVHPFSLSIIKSSAYALYDDINTV